VKIPYRTFPDRHGGYVYSVNLDVSVSQPNAGSARTRSFEAIIDSGASRCVFHGDIGRLIGLDIRSGNREAVQGIGGLADTFLHDIALHAPGGPILIKAAFQENLSIAGLLGMNGFFEHFRITFDTSALTCEIERLDRQ
jgi:hypothetical protein